MIRYEVLGPLGAVRGQDRLVLGPLKQRAVLAMLLLDVDHALTSEQMIDALWADSPPRAAVASLQAYVSNLRRVLEPDRAARSAPSVLQTVAGGYRLVVEPDDVDAVRFANAISVATALVERDPQRARALLDDALALWRGPALADFRYDDFAQREIERLDELRAHALEVRIAADLAVGRSADLIPEIEALVREHPHRERLRAHQMLALYRAGRQTEALAAYREFATMLRDELGLDPNPELRDLQHAILDHAPHLDAPQMAGARPVARRPLAATAPLVVGRDNERQRFHDALVRAQNGRGSVLLIEGEPGVGKTRLLEHFHHEAGHLGAITALARCVEVGGTPPFWPWMQLIRQLDPDNVAAAAGNYRGHLAPLLGPLIAPAAEPDRSVTTGAPLFRVAEGLAVVLQTFAESAPSVLLIDDVYSSDPDSLSLLALLASELDRLPVVVVASHRGVDASSSSQLANVVAQLRRLDWVDDLRVRRFDEPEIADLIGSLTGNEVDRALAAAVHERTNGNAFFAIELTKLLQSEERLDATNARSVVPGSIRDVVGKRLDQLSDDTVRLLRVGAVVGREFELTMLADVVGVDVDTLVSSVDEAVRAGLLRPTDRAGTYRFAHVIVVDAVVHSLGAVRRAQLHQQVADGIEGLGVDSPEAWVDIAHHRTEAIAIAGVPSAVDALATAGRRAMAADALELAETLFERRRALVDSLSASSTRDTLEVDALLDLVRVWTSKDGYHFGPLGAATARVWELTGLRRGAATLDTDAPITAADPILSALQARVSFDVVRSDVASAQLAIDRYLELAERYDDPMVVFGANFAATVVWLHAGRVADAVTATTRAAAALDILDPSATNNVMLPVGQHSARVAHHSFAGWAHYLAGDRERAEHELRTSRQCCERTGNRFTFGFAAAVEGAVAAMDGSPAWAADTVAWGRADLDDGVFGLMDVWHDVLTAWVDGMGTGDPVAAANRIRDDLQALEADGAFAVHTLYWAMVASLEQRAGRAEQVLAATARGIAHVDRFGERFWYPELERIAAVALLDLGRVDEGHAAHRRAVAAARELGIRPLMDRLAASASA